MMMMIVMEVQWILYIGWYSSVPHSAVVGLVCHVWGEGGGRGRKGVGMGLVERKGATLCALFLKVGDSAAASTAKSTHYTVYIHTHTYIYKYMHGGQRSRVAVCVPERLFLFSLISISITPLARSDAAAAAVIPAQFSADWPSRWPDLLPFLQFVASVGWDCFVSITRIIHHLHVQITRFHWARMGRGGRSRPEATTATTATTSPPPSALSVT